jgi:hypothetical protein
MEDGANWTDGTFSQANFIEYFVDVLNDFCWRTGISRMVMTQPVELGVSQYATPNNMSDPDACFLGGVYIPKKTQEELDNLQYSWVSASGVPSAWHQDGLPIQTMEVYPNPSYNGPTYGVPTTPPGVTGTFNPADYNLTFVGTQIPPAITYTTASVVPLVPDSAQQFLEWGVIARMLQDSSENRDLPRSAYASARYEQGILLFRAIVLEQELNEVDELAA